MRHYTWGESGSGHGGESTSKANYSSWTNGDPSSPAKPWKAEEKKVNRFGKVFLPAPTFFFPHP